MNKIICGDALTEIKKLESNSIDLICIDPPYLTTNEKWDKEEVVNVELAQELFRILKDTGNLYSWCGIGEKSQSLIRWFPIFNKIFHFKDLITWKKQRGIGMRKGWLYTREELMWFVKDNKKFVWNKEEQYSTEKPTFRPSYAIKNNLYRSAFKRLTNVWIDIFEDGMGTCCKESTRISKEKKASNIAIKPVKALERIIKSHTKENDIILDCFAGSGSTGVACKNLNRQYILIEKEKDYCDIIKQRLNE